MLTTLAVLLVGVYLMVTSQEHVGATATLVFGIVVAALALAELLRGYGPIVRRN